MLDIVILKLLKQVYFTSLLSHYLPHLEIDQILKNIWNVQLIILWLYKKPILFIKVPLI